MSSLLDAIEQVETGGNPRAVSNKGARGAFQIMPSTFRQYADKGMDPFNREHSRIVASRYLDDLSKQFNGDVPSILASYNGGQGRYERRGRNINKMPKETRDYVPKVMKLLNPIGSAQADETPSQGADDSADWEDYTPIAAQAVDDSADWEDYTPPVQAQNERDSAPTVPRPDNAGVMSQAPGNQNTGVMSQAQHKLGVAGRGVIEGVAGIPQTIYNTAQIIPNALKNKLGYKAPFEAPEAINTEQYGTGVADYLGLPKATKNDQLLYPVAKAVGGFALPAAGIAKFKTGANMAGSVASQLPGITLGVTARDTAKRMGAGETGQLVADVAGNIAGGGLANVAQGVTRMTGRATTAGLGTKKGLEGVAGRSMNRAAGEESPQLVDALATGRIPIIENPIPGYKPKTSQYGNPGLSTLLRVTGQNADTQTALKAADFKNIKSITDYAKTGYMGKEARDVLDTELKKKVDVISKPMRRRNLPVNLDTPRKIIEREIADKEGNDNVVKHLQSVLDDMPASGSGYNKVYNFKQGLDEKLRAPSFNDPQLASFQKAGASLKRFKQAYAKEMNRVEPETAAYLKEQAQGLSAIDQSAKAEKTFLKSRIKTPMISMASGAMEEIRPISSASLLGRLENEKTVKSISDAQHKHLSNVQKHAALASQSQAGSMVGSSTAQNFATRDAVYNDLIKAGFGEKPGLLGSFVGGLGARVGAVPGVHNAVKAVGESHAEALSQIFAKAELDPKYAAELMKTYGLGHLNFNDTAGRAALRGLLNNQGSRQ